METNKRTLEINFVTVPCIVIGEDYVIMKNKLKVSICAIWLLILVVMVSLHNLQKISGQTRETNELSNKTLKLAPEALLVNQFDKVVQRRFLTEPGFGMARMAPLKPVPLESNHVRSFSPVSEEEKGLVSGFENKGWKVGLYLFGRQALPNGNKNNRLDKFKIRYRVNQPVPITWGLQEKQLPSAKKLMKEVKEAYLFFQKNERTSESSMQFTKGEWTFVAKPVRAANESCIRCHTDYVITEKLNDDRYKFRKRAVGDVNGIIIYGFSRNETSEVKP